jgi:hypothetical protein
VADNRRLKVLLGILGAVTLAWAYVTFVAAPPAAGGGPTSQNVPRAAPATASTTAPDVNTEALAHDRPRPGANVRDLFKFRPKYVPPPPVARVEAAPPMPSGPPPPPPVPPIPLKFIGLLEPSAGQRVAVLSDGKGAPFYGREGEAVLGQYRILRIGAESIELEYIDGRGRQAIRLSGS